MIICVIICVINLKVDDGTPQVLRRYRAQIDKVFHFFAGAAEAGAKEQEARLSSRGQVRATEPARDHELS